MTTLYNNNMLPIDVRGMSNYVPSMTYDIAGRLLTRALGNGLTQTYEYYPWNQQGGRLHTLVTGTLQNITYQYDSVGNITQTVDSLAGETSVYAYDALDRLTSWTLNQNSPETYTYDAQGNLDVKNGLDLNYNDAAHKHAVTSVSNQSSVNSYQYDQNGNQITRSIGSDTFNLIYDAENRLVEVKKNDTTIALFTYDGDGKRVKSVMSGETTLFAGSHFEQKGSQVTKYYFAGAIRIALRKYTTPQSMTVEYLLGDHLGSTGITTDTNGGMVSEIRYKPWGETRYTSIDAPANTSPAYELVKYQYTGQYSYDVEFGLKYYGARWLDSTTGRFTQPDTLVPAPNNSQSWDRFAYVGNNPCRSGDPDGHCWPVCTMVIGAALGAIAGAVWYTAANISTGHYSNEGMLSAAGKGAVVGAMVGLAAPAAAVLVGQGLMGVGLATGSTALWSAGIATVDAGAAVMAGTYGVAAVVDGPGVTTENVTPSITAQRFLPGDPGAGTVVIGRDMNRVNAYADYYGYETWTGYDPALKTTPEDLVNLANNRAWAEAAEAAGKTVIDIGLDPQYTIDGNYATGDFYPMECSVFFGC